VKSRKCPVLLVGAALAMFVSFGVATVEAWGAQGHRLVALIAADHLTSAARQNIAWLLPDSSLADIAVWADQQVADNTQTGPWHYVNLRQDATAYNRDRDCPRQPGVAAGTRNDQWRDCVVDRILYHHLSTFGRLGVPVQPPWHLGYGAHRSSKVERAAISRRAFRPDYTRSPDDPPRRLACRLGHGVACRGEARASSSTGNRQRRVLPHVYRRNRRTPGGPVESRQAWRDQSRERGCSHYWSQTGRSGQQLRIRQNDVRRLRATKRPIGL